MLPRKENVQYIRVELCVSLPHMPKASASISNINIRHALLYIYFFIDILVIFCEHCLPRRYHSPQYGCPEHCLCYCLPVNSHPPLLSPSQKQKKVLFCLVNSPTLWLMEAIRKAWRTTGYCRASYPLSATFSWSSQCGLSQTLSGIECSQKENTLHPIFLQSWSCYQPSFVPKLFFPPELHF